LITFLSKEKYTISNAIVTVIYQISYNIKFLTLIPLYKGKGKPIPLQVWTGPVGSRRLRLPDFKTIST